MRLLTDIAKSVIHDYNSSLMDFRAVSRSGGDKLIYNRAYRRMRRREITPGFPRQEPLSRREAERYMKGAVSVCLLCGKEYSSVAVHIATNHNVKPREYAIAYKLPLTFGLISPQLKAIASTTAKTNKRFIEQRELHGDEYRVKARANIPMRYAEKKGIATFHSEQSAVNVSHSPGYLKYKDVDYLRILNLMVSNDMPYGEVQAAFDDIPRDCVFYKWVRKSKENAKLYKEANESLSFAAQARGQVLGRRFIEAAKIALKVHTTYKDAAASLGVSEMALRRHLHGGRGIPL